MLKVIPAAHILLLVCTTNILYAEIIYDFSNNTKLKGWNIVDDNVMGGRSRGFLRLDSNNNGVFSGYISLKNYGVLIGFPAIGTIPKSFKTLIASLLPSAAAFLK